MTAPAEDPNLAVIERMRNLYSAGDFEAIERAALDYWTDETVDEFPQSGEVFRGRAAAEGMTNAWPEATGGWPRFILREIRGREDLWVLEGTVDYGGGVTASSVTIVELRDGKIVRQTDYFASPFEAPEWRRPFRVAP